MAQRPVGGGCALRKQLEDILKSDLLQEAQKRILDPEAREEFAATLLKIHDPEEDGIRRIEQALSRHAQGGRAMEPKFVEREAFTVMGIQERFTPETEDFDGIWKRYMAHQKTIEPLSDAKGWYGVSFNVEGQDTLDYFAGMAVPADANCPEGLVVREVPAARYAVFECTVQTIHDTYEHIFHTWVPGSPYTHDQPKPCFEQYPPGTDSGESPVLIHVPIREKEM